MATLTQLGILVLSFAAGYMMMRPRKPTLKDGIYLAAIFFFAPTLLRFATIASLSLYGVFLDTMFQAFILGIAATMLKARP